MRDEESFSYTADRGQYITIVVVFVVIVLIEGFAIDALVVFLVHNTVVKAVVIAVVTLVHVTILAFFSAPLRTRHRVGSDRLQVRYGIDRLDIPREIIAEAIPVREPLGPFDPVRAQYQPDKERISAAFSERGEVLIRLTEPRTFRLNRSGKPVTAVLINVDDRDRFLTVLLEQRVPPYAPARPARRDD
ncbi:MAG TPA: hypothetical protein VFA78_05780 [Chloroflexota bacterium]|nr:hypothetical protein [Chloroflexota bacterium]